MTFIECVNRILTKAGYLQGDTDALIDFNNLQHRATSNMAKAAIQEAVGDLLAEYLIPEERITATIVTNVDQRIYLMPADFGQFWQQKAFFADGNNQIFEYPGGEQRLQLQMPDYLTQGGNPASWYWVDAELATVGFFPVPDAMLTLTYDYQKTIVPQLASDNLPFQQESQAIAFTEMASARFEAVFTGQHNTDMRRAPAYVSATAKVRKLLDPKRPVRRYGSVYF